MARSLCITIIKFTDLQRELTCCTVSLYTLLLAVLISSLMLTLGGKHSANTAILQAWGSSVVLVMLALPRGLGVVGEGVRVVVGLRVVTSVSLVFVIVSVVLVPTPAVVFCPHIEPLGGNLNINSILKH